LDEHGKAVVDRRIPRSGIQILFRPPKDETSLPPAGDAVDSVRGAGSGVSVSARSIQSDDPAIDPTAWPDPRRRCSTSARCSAAMAGTRPTSDAEPARSSDRIPWTWADPTDGSTVG
jgi:hypothetical protein